MKASDFVNLVFGTRPFEVVITRTRVDETGAVKADASDTDVAKADGETEIKAASWRWDIQLPMDAPKITAAFEAVLLDSIQPLDEDAPSAVTIITDPTNIGDAMKFSFANAIYCRHGKRRLVREFKKARSAWVAAKSAVAWAWHKGDLLGELKQHVKAFCHIVEPSQVNNLKIGFIDLAMCRKCGNYHTPRDIKIAGLASLIASVVFESPGIVMLYEKDLEIHRSPFYGALVDRIRLTAIDLIKAGMIQFMTSEQDSLLVALPKDIVHGLQRFTETMAKMGEMGLTVELDPMIGMMLEALKSHLNIVAIRKGTHAAVRENVAAAQPPVKADEEQSYEAAHTPSTPEIPPPPSAGTATMPPVAVQPPAMVHGAHHFPSIAESDEAPN